MQGLHATQGASLAPFCCTLHARCVVIACSPNRISCIGLVVPSPIAIGHMSTSRISQNNISATIDAFHASATDAFVSCPQQPPRPTLQKPA